VGSEDGAGLEVYAARACLPPFIGQDLIIGESRTPYRWRVPQFALRHHGHLRLPKNNYLLLSVVVTDKDILHIYPHWNWKGKEGQPIDVWCQSNAETVELFPQRQSLVKQSMQLNSHLNGRLPYEPGTLERHADRKGANAAKIETTSAPAASS